MPESSSRSWRSWRMALVETLATRGRAALLLYAAAGLLGSIVLLVVWQKTPVGRIIEELLGAVPPAASVPPTTAPLTAASAQPSPAFPATPAGASAPVADTVAAPSLLQEPATAVSNEIPAPSGTSAVPPATEPPATQLPRRSPSPPLVAPQTRASDAGSRLEQSPTAATAIPGTTAIGLSPPAISPPPAASRERSAPADGGAPPAGLGPPTPIAALPVLPTVTPPALPTVDTGTPLAALATRTPTLNPPVLPSMDVGGLLSPLTTPTPTSAATPSGPTPTPLVALSGAATSVGTTAAHVSGTVATVAGTPGVLATATDASHRVATAVTTAVAIFTPALDSAVAIASASPALPPLAGAIATSTPTPAPVTGLSLTMPAATPPPVPAATL